MGAVADHSDTPRSRALVDADVRRLRDSVRTKDDEDTFDGRFTLLGEAGSGGMGIVYEAIDRDSGKRVAIKVITGLPSPNDRARFAAEADALERLDHPVIVDYVCHGVTRRGEPYLAMEWLVGESLSERLRRETLSVGDATLLGERIADALAHAHREGIVHRDLKPSNIFLVDGKVAQAHLIDFGVAKLDDRDLTKTGQMIGTPGYMAPEQVRGEKTANQSVDLFALGCVLYRALTGREPFPGSEVMEVLARLLLEHPQPIEELVVDVPPRLSHLVGSLMAKESERRLGDAAIARDELRAIREALVAKDTTALELRPGVVPAPPVSTLVDTIGETPRTRAARRRSWPLVIGVAVAVAVALVLVMARRSGPTCSDTIRTGCAALCDDGDADACYLHARTLHKNDVGIPIDHEAARVADRRACTLGNDAGCVGAARSLFDSARTFPPGDERRTSRESDAVQLLAGACDRRYYEACRKLGREYSRGWGQLVPDPPRAFELVERSCLGDHVEGCNALRDMIADDHNGGTPALRAHAREVYAAACRRRLVTCLP
jgi:hypothetical protein